jgi:hypothetical protein
MKVFTKSQLQKLWADGKSIERKGKKYFCNRMSYGEYFFEPIPNYGEREGFAPNTIWIGSHYKKG